MNLVFSLVGAFDVVHEIWSDLVFHGSGLAPRALADNCLADY